MKNEYIFSERLSGKIHCWRLRGSVFLPVGLGSVQWMTSMLFLFLPSLLVEDRQWIQSLYLPGLSWAVTILPLYSLGRAVRLVVLWIRACPDIANLFSFSCTIPLEKKVAVQSPKCAIISRRHSQGGGEWKIKVKASEKASQFAATIRVLFFELVAVLL